MIHWDDVLEDILNKGFKYCMDKYNLSMYELKVFILVQFPNYFDSKSVIHDGY